MRKLESLGESLCKLEECPSTKLSNSTHFAFSKGMDKSDTIQMTQSVCVNYSNNSDIAKTTHSRLLVV